MSKLRKIIVQLLYLLAQNLLELCSRITREIKHHLLTSVSSMRGQGIIRVVVVIVVVVVVVVIVLLLLHFSDILRIRNISIF